MQKELGLKRFLVAPTLAFALASGAVAPAQAQIPGLLPSIEDVTPLDPLPIDGTWRIREINELIVIDSGHAYAVDGWIHALVFKIMPGHVVLSDLQERGDGTISGQDLPLMAPITLSPVDDYTVRATVHGLIPVTYHLDLVGPNGAFIPDRQSEDESPFPADDALTGDEDESWFAAKSDD